MTLVPLKGMEPPGRCATAAGAATAKTPGGAEGAATETGEPPERPDIVT
jgi:hypothetical protein